jgi:hypothetical protein
MAPSPSETEWFPVITGGSRVRKPRSAGAVCAAAETDAAASAQPRKIATPLVWSVRVLIGREGWGEEIRSTGAPCGGRLEIREQIILDLESSCGSRLPFSRHSEVACAESSSSLPSVRPKNLADADRDRLS